MYMKKYLLVAILSVCALSALAVALWGGESEPQQDNSKTVWNFVSMRSVCYMSVECVTPDFSPIQESIYENRLMYGELPLSFALTIETDCKDSILAVPCKIESGPMEMECELKDLQFSEKEGKRVCSGIFVYDLSKLAKEAGVPAVMDMIRKFPKDSEVYIKPALSKGSFSDYFLLKR